jgi:hypothetical protein
MVCQDHMLIGRQCLGLSLGLGLCFGLILIIGLGLGVEVFIILGLGFIDALRNLTMIED